MLGRFLPLALGLAVAVGLVAPAQAATSHPAGWPTTATATGPHQALADSPTMVPPGEPGGYATVQTVLRYATGKRIGPNSYTGGGQFTITGFVQSPTGWERVRSAATCPACTTLGLNPGAVHPDGLPQWAEPWTWDWGHILGSVWGTLWNQCLSGAAKGVVGSAGSTLLTNLIAAGGKVYLGPYGYAAIAIGGCIALALD